MQNLCLKLVLASVGISACVYSAGISSAAMFDDDRQMRCYWFQQQVYKAGIKANEAPPGSQTEKRYRQKAQCWRQTYSRCMRGAIFPDDRSC
jgi:hypothetical protein